MKDPDLQNEKPYVLRVDVGGPAKIGWADAEGQDGKDELIMPALVVGATAKGAIEPITI